MALATSTARQGLLRALARSTTQLTTAKRSLACGAATACPTGTGVGQHPWQQQQLQQQHLLLRRAAAVPQNYHEQRWEQQRRSFSAGGGGNEDDSDDDFKPQRKAVSDNPDDISALIKKQVPEMPKTGGFSVLHVSRVLL